MLSCHRVAEGGGKPEVSTHVLTSEWGPCVQAGDGLKLLPVCSFIGPGTPSHHRTNILARVQRFLGEDIENTGLALTGPQVLAFIYSI